MNPRIRQTGPKLYQIMSTPKPKKPTRQTKAELLTLLDDACRNAVVNENRNLLLGATVKRLERECEELRTINTNTVQQLREARDLSWWDRLWGAK